MGPGGIPPSSAKSLRNLELPIGVREYGAFCAFGPAALFFHVASWEEIAAQCFGLRGVDGIGATHNAAALMRVPAGSIGAQTSEARRTPSLAKTAPRRLHKTAKSYRAVAAHSCADASVSASHMESDR